MRITVELDDELLADAATLTDIREPSALLHEALKALVERERSATRRARRHRTHSEALISPSLGLIRSAFELVAGSWQLAA
jgi:Arc/MetJ family transcription regulator